MHQRTMIRFWKTKQNNILNFVKIMGYTEKTLTKFKLSIHISNIKFHPHPSSSCGDEMCVRKKEQIQHPHYVLIYSLSVKNA
jgi:uncharacterized protein (DUF2344 family)